jgi:hypothetical protein
MLQKNFKIFFLENILDFLWRQWSTLGIAGSARCEDRWIIDPEALIVFSLNFARYDSRLFDEILDWLIINAKWIDIQRLRGILKNKDETIRRLISAVAFLISKEAKTYQRKWRPLGLSQMPDSVTQYDILFKTKEGKDHPKSMEQADIFFSYGFIRKPFKLRKMSKPIPITIKSNIRFLLRALLGIGSRSECVLYLLTHEAGHPSEIADAIGISTRGTQDALIELAESGLVLTRIKGKRKLEYWFSQKKWWEFITGMNFGEVKIPLWINWIVLFSALTNVWDVLQEVEKTKSEYMRSSKLREAMNTISIEFSNSRLDLPIAPGNNITPQKYEDEFQNFIIKVLGAKSDTNR